MKWRCSITLVLALSLTFACGGEDPVLALLGENRAQLELAPDSVLELDLPGCEDMHPQLFHPSTAVWRLALHPYDAELLVLSRGKAPTCITAATQTSPLLQALLVSEAPDPAIRPRTKLAQEDEANAPASDEELRGEAATGIDPTGLRMQRFSSTDVQDDPIPVPRTAGIATKSGS